MAQVLGQLAKRELRRGSVIGGFRSLVRAAAELERTADQVRATILFDATPIQAQIERTQAEVERLTAARFRLDSWVSDAAKPAETVRERALNLRRNRNTGPDEVPFRHRGRA